MKEKIIILQPRILKCNDSVFYLEDEIIAEKEFEGIVVARMVTNGFTRIRMVDEKLCNAYGEIRYHPDEFDCNTDEKLIRLERESKIEFESNSWFEVIILDSDIEGEIFHNYTNALNCLKKLDIKKILIERI